MIDSSSCWFPDGTLVAYVPCDPSASYSPCCAGTETCLGRSLCLGNGGVVYRGGCTDKTFKDKACAIDCIDKSGRNAGTQSSHSFIKPCSRTPDGKTLWVCGLSGNCSDENAIFDMTIGPPTATNISGIIADTRTISVGPPTSRISPTSIVSTAISATTISSTPISLPTISLTTTIPLASSTKSFSATTESPACPSQKVSTAGVAIGVPLAILSILMSLLFLRERRRRKDQYLQKETWKSTAEKPATHLKTVQSPVQNQVSEVSGGYLGNELEDEELNRFAWRRNGGVNELP